MLKYITILNKKRVDLLVNWNILCRNTVQSWTKRELIYLKTGIFYVEIQYNHEQKESWFTCKLEYFISKHSTIMNKKRVDLLVYLHMYFQTWICYAWNKKRVKGHIEKVLHNVVNSLLYDRSLLHKYILYVADPPQCQVYLCLYRLTVTLSYNITCR